MSERNATVYYDGSMNFYRKDGSSISGWATDYEGNRMAAEKNSLDCLDAIPAEATMTVGSVVTVEHVQKAINMLNQNQEKENTMRHYSVETNPSISTDLSIIAATPTDQKQREYLREQLSNAYWAQTNKLEKAFYIYAEDPPRSFNELLERITNGRYTIDKDKMETRSYDTGLDHVVWRDPKHPKDEEGYNAAMLKAQAARTQAERIIQVKSPEEGLAALETFEAATFH